MRARKRIYLEPRAVERAHREATALARGARISHLLRVVDAFFGMVFACLLFVAGAWTLTRSPLDVGGESLSAVPSVAPQIVAVSASAPALAEPLESPGGNGALMRDEQLDRYLAAHKQFSSASALGAPPGALRQVTVEAAGR